MRRAAGSAQRHGERHRPLALSLNGQDVAAATTVNFTYWAPPVPLSIWPPAGPADGRTAVTIRGAGFGGGGALLQCRFGEAAVVAEPNASDGTLVCVAAARRRRARRTGAAAADCELHGAAALAANGPSWLTGLGSFDAEDRRCGRRGAELGRGASRCR